MKYFKVFQEGFDPLYPDKNNSYELFAGYDKPRNGVAVEITEAEFDRLSNLKLL